jgi:hypothetical protein
MLIYFPESRRADLPSSTPGPFIVSVLQSAGAQVEKSVEYAYARSVDGAAATVALPLAVADESSRFSIDAQAAHMPQASTAMKVVALPDSLRLPLCFFA